MAREFGGNLHFKEGTGTKAQSCDTVRTEWWFVELDKRFYGPVWPCEGIRKRCAPCGWAQPLGV